MEQNIYGSAFGTASFRITYRTLELQTAPALTATSLGTLKRGAVVTILEDVSRYFYKVHLDNGLEGYVYKPGGELSNNLPPTPLPRVETSPGPNGALPAADIDGAVVRNKLNGVEPPLKNGSSPAPNHSNNQAQPPTTIYSNMAQRRGNNNNGPRLIITSGEIAALDKPGIVGRQVAKLRHNDIVSLVSQDSFFYQVALPNGAHGYIPRYTAEPYHQV